MQECIRLVDIVLYVWFWLTLKKVAKFFSSFIMKEENDKERGWFNWIRDLKVDGCQSNIYVFLKQLYLL